MPLSAISSSGNKLPPKSQAKRVATEESKRQDETEHNISLMEDSIHLTNEEITKGVDEAR
jgi:hypothetical protein